MQLLIRIEDAPAHALAETTPQKEFYDSRSVNDGHDSRVRLAGFPLATRSLPQECAVSDVPTTPLWSGAQRSCESPAAGSPTATFPPLPPEPSACDGARPARSEAESSSPCAKHTAMCIT